MDVQLHSRNTCLDTNDYVGSAISTAGTNQITITMRNGTDEGDLVAYWQTDADPTWTAGKGQTFTRVLTRRDGSYRTYTLTITDADWTGTLRALELCLAGAV